MSTLLNRPEKLFVSSWIEAASVCDSNFLVFADKIDSIAVKTDILNKVVNKKANKLGVFVLAIAGIAYVLKNEIDKDNLRGRLVKIERDKVMDVKSLGI